VHKYIIFYLLYLHAFHFKILSYLEIKCAADTMYNLIRIIQNNKPVLSCYSFFRGPRGHE
jgi:hypothetical protein